MKFLKSITKISGIILIVIIIFFVYLMVTYGPKYAYRYTFWTPPGNSDFQKFPTRKILNSDKPFQFEKKTDEAYIESLFNYKFRILGVTNFEEYIKKTKTTALIIIENDTIIYEKYFNGFQREDLSLAWSMTKSYVYSLIGIAINEGHISSVEDPITKYLPELIKQDQRFKKITLKNLLMMSSGIEQRKSALFNVIPLPWDEDPISYYHPNLRKYILKNLNIISEPGKQFYYNDFNAELLGLILERAIDQTVSEYLEEKIWKPCGMEFPALWGLDSEKSGFEKKSSSLFARPIDFARYGRLYLKFGNWEGKQLIPKDWVIESTSDETTLNIKDYYPPVPSKWHRNTHYKYHWKGHMDSDSSMSYSISGVLGQHIFIAPHKNLIIVHCATSHQFYGVEDLWSISRLMDIPFYKIMHTHGLSGAIAYADSLLKNNQEKIVSEGILNLIGYDLIYEGKLEDAIAIFELSIRLYPSSSNAYDSLGEAYMKNDQIELSIKNYEKSLELNSDNENAREMLNKLKH